MIRLARTSLYFPRDFETLSLVSALPFLRDAVYFLYPAGVVIVLYVLSLILGVNCSIVTMNLYFS